MRFIPSDPRVSCAHPIYKAISDRVFAWEPGLTIRHHLQELTEDSTIVEYARLTPDYPLIYDDTLWFFLSQYMEFDEIVVLFLITYCIFNLIMFKSDNLYYFLVPMFGYPFCIGLVCRETTISIYHT